MGFSSRRSSLSSAQSARTGQGSTVLGSIIHKWNTPHDRFNLAMGWILFVHSGDACVGPGRVPSQSPAGLVQGSAWLDCNLGNSRVALWRGRMALRRTGEGTGVVYRLAQRIFAQRGPRLFLCAD